MDSHTKKRIVLWSAVTVAIVGLVALLSYVGSGGGVADDLTRPVAPSEHVKGDADASVTLVEYSDFQCSSCRSVAPILEDLLVQYPNDFRIVYRHFPLRPIHKNAQLASQASEAAGMQEKFWEYYAMLFNTQNDWTDLPDPAQFFVNLADSLGLNTTRFAEDMLNDAAREAVNRGAAEAAKMNLSGTPTFFLNGKRLNLQSFDDLKSHVGALLPSAE